MEFEDRLRAVIGDSTIDEFAASIDEPSQRVKDILRKKQKPPADFLVKLQVTLGVDLNWLLVGGDRPAVALSVRESNLLQNYRASAAEGRKAIEQTSVAVSKRSEADPGMTSKKAA